VLREVPDEVESVMMIGHNPGIQDLALSLAGGGPEIARVRSKFPTAALATLELDGSWRELAPGSAELVSFVKPKELSRGAAGAR
jgi:phosphohistidine phosphatase